MKKLDTWVDYLAVAVIAAAVLAILVSITACTPQSTVPFDPSKKQDVAEEQKKTIVPGAGAPFSGMDCLKQVEYQIAYCEATQACTSMLYNRLRRAARRLDKGYRSQCLYSEDHIKELYRHFDRQQRHRPVGG